MKKSKNRILLKNLNRCRSLSESFMKKCKNLILFKNLNRYRSETFQIRSCTGRLSQKKDIRRKGKVVFVFFIDFIIQDVKGPSVR
jgi:hypothetical protein